MKTNYSDMNEEELEKDFEGYYSFDPTQIVTLVSQNPQLGLALVQLPITIANSLMRKHNDLKWSDHPTSPGYYWVNFNGSIGIKEYSSVEIDAVISLGNPRQYKYAGPLEPPQ